MPQGKNTKKSSIASLRAAVKSLAAPASFFSGLTLCNAMRPDNIIFFKRTDTAALRLKGVSSNFHHRFELVVLLEKSGSVRIGDLSYDLQPGEAALIFPNEFHHYLDIDSGSMEWLFITFELANEKPISPLKEAPRILDRSLMKLLGSILDEYVNPSNGQPDAAEISCLLARLLRGMVDAPVISGNRQNTHSTKDTRDVILEKINIYVRSHLSEATTIGMLADALGYSASYLRAVFRTRLGVNLGRYIRESRLSHASTLLESTDLNVSEVAKKSGFESPVVFSRTFKKAYGVSPKAYSQRVNGRQARYST